MVFQRQRDEKMLRQLEEYLNIYQKTLRAEQFAPIFKTILEHGQCYDLDTIDDLLETYHDVHGAAMEIYDALYPPTPEEECRLSKARRRFILQMGII